VASQRELRQMPGDSLELPCAIAGASHLSKSCAKTKKILNRLVLNDRMRGENPKTSQFFCHFFAIAITLRCHLLIVLDRCFEGLSSSGFLSSVFSGRGTTMGFSNAAFARHNTLPFRSASHGCSIQRGTAHCPWWCKSRIARDIDDGPPLETAILSGPFCTSQSISFI
jgi:hypothetical protein